MKRKREVSDVAGAARRMIRALGRRCGDEDPIDLQLILQLHDEVDAAYVAAMRQLHDKHGFSDAEIGSGVGITRQAARKRRLGGAASDVA